MEDARWTELAARLERFLSRIECPPNEFATKEDADLGNIMAGLDAAMYRFGGAVDDIKKMLDCIRKCLETAGGLVREAKRGPTVTATSAPSCFSDKMVVRSYNTGVIDLSRVWSWVETLEILPCSPTSRPGGEEFDVSVGDVPTCHTIVGAKLFVKDKDGHAVSGDDKGCDSE